MVIVFRGRHTADILRDALGAGIVPLAQRVVIIARKGDALAQEGDITPDQFRIDGEDDIIILANGGTTAQLVPVVVKVATAAQRWDDEADEWLRDSRAEHARSAPRPWKWVVWDVQPEGCTKLAGDPP